MRKPATVLLVWWAACSDQPVAPAVDASEVNDASEVRDTVAADAAPVVSATCGGEALVFSRSEAEVTAALEALLTDAQAVEPQTYYHEAVDGTRRDAWLSGMHVALPVSGDAEPRPAAIAWLAASSPDTLVASEWTIDPFGAPIDPQTIAPGDVLVGRMVRTSIDGVPWPGDYPTRWVEGGGIQLIIEKTADGWDLRDARLTPATALATRADAELLAACEPPLPGPEDLLRQFTYTGLEFSACEPLREYSYVPAAGDSTRWVPGLGFALGELIDGRSRWHAFVEVELTIAEENYWPTIAYADCVCDDGAGFTLRVDAVTGDVLRFRPGLGCVVC